MGYKQIIFLMKYFFLLSTFVLKLVRWNMQDAVGELKELEGAERAVTLHQKTKLAKISLIQIETVCRRQFWLESIMHFLMERVKYICKEIYELCAGKRGFNASTKTN